MHESPFPDGCGLRGKDYKSLFGIPGQPSPQLATFSIYLFSLTFYVTFVYNWGDHEERR